jgi:dihydroorotase
VSRLLVSGGRVLDPVAGRDERLDVLIEDGRVAALAPALELTDCERVDASGLWVVPGFVDLHTHLREPGEEYKEDICSGGRAAAAGGFTAIACMANTHPVNDDPSVTDFILDRARQEAPVRILPIAAATKGLGGETMTEMDALVRAGAVAFSDDGKTVMNGGTMRRILQYSKLVAKPIIVHAEDRTLVGEGVLNEGPVSTRLGLPGNPGVAEVSLVARDLMLAELTGAHLHIAHVSTAGAVDLIREARARGVHVTSEATPHHLTLTDEASLCYDTNTKVAPPLRGAADRDAIRRGLAEGVIDAIATDHAPHAEHEKESDFRSAPPGMIGLETAFAVVSDLVRSGTLSPLELVRRMSSEPARIIGCPGGSLAEGAVADVALLDPDAVWTYDPTKGYSKSRNSPWAGVELRGRVRATLVAGQLVYDVERGVLHP